MLLVRVKSFCKKKKNKKFKTALITSFILLLIYITTDVYHPHPTYQAFIYAQSLTLFVIIYENLFFLCKSFWIFSYCKNLFLFMFICKKFFFYLCSSVRTYFIRYILETSILKCSFWESNFKVHLCFEMHFLREQLF